VIFESFDLNGDSQISPDELARSIRKSLQGSMKMLAADPNQNPAELCKIIGKCDETVVKRTVAHIFSECDANSVRLSFN
jgi:Ca2+-binding EF-hand superfamily protein